MSKYRITLTYRCTFEGIEVEADSDEEAERLARDIGLSKNWGDFDEVDYDDFEIYDKEDDDDEQG